VGPYKLLERIGEGGFGAVYMAEQREPVQRRVALKIIKAGMDTRQVIARFEAERQALAMMDHPNIARVLDAGATENVVCGTGVPPVASDICGTGIPPVIAAGRPYFVMELVKGVPITQFCDEQRLPLRDRMALFSDVCHAVQHAHQKGVIHRDLKPTNVLVSQVEGGVRASGPQAVVKIIDFGIAKAVAGAGPLTDKTLVTEFRQLIGTPAYMSPEQAQLSGLDIDTRSDIYSLGVLLYELLTGTTPFDSKALLDSGFEEMLRTIREVEPPKPSTRLASLSVASNLRVRRRGSGIGDQGSGVASDLRVRRKGAWSEDLGAGEDGTSSAQLSDPRSPIPPFVPPCLRAFVPLCSTANPTGS
jgi:non-specific serine/threonine protein kinase/serine/threonine-protein kinase